MKQFFPRGFPAAPIAAWLALSTAAAEMLLASSHVIGHRTGRMLQSGAVPNAADRREFALMSSEKIDASLRSAQAMLSLGMSMWPAMAAQLLTSQVAMASALGSLAASRTPGEAAARSRRAVQTISNSPLHPARLAHSATRMTRRGIGPIRSRAVANSKRLRKV